AVGMHRLMNVSAWGEHRGGMFVEVGGVGRGGERVMRSWHLIAEGDDGPRIPSMAAAAIVRRVLDGRRPASGASPATADLGLGDYAPVLAVRKIYAGQRQTEPEFDRAPLYRRILGGAWASLPPALQAMHDVGDGLAAAGEAKVERGTGLLARLAAMLFRR